MAKTLLFYCLFLCLFRPNAEQQVLSGDELLSNGLDPSEEDRLQELLRGLILIIYGEELSTEVQTRIQTCLDEQQTLDNLVFAQIGRSLTLIVQVCSSEDRVTTMNRAVYELLDSLQAASEACSSDLNDIEADAALGVSSIAAELQTFIDRLNQSLGFDGIAAVQTLQNSLQNDVLPLLSLLPNLETAENDLNSLSEPVEGQLMDMLREANAPGPIMTTVQDLFNASTQWMENQEAGETDLLVNVVAVIEDQYSSQNFSTASGNVASAMISLLSDYSTDQIQTLVSKLRAIYALILPYLDQLCVDLPALLQEIGAFLNTYNGLIQAIENIAVAPANQ